MNRRIVVEGGELVGRGRAGARGPPRGRAIARDARRCAQACTQTTAATYYFPEGPRPVATEFRMLAARDPQLPPADAPRGGAEPRLVRGRGAAGRGHAPARAPDREVPNVLDLSALGPRRGSRWTATCGIGRDGRPLQDVIDSPLRPRRDRRPSAPRPRCLPSSRRAWSAGWRRWAARSVYAAHDSEVVAALLALNAVFVVSAPTGPLETRPSASSATRPTTSRRAGCCSR